MIYFFIFLGFLPSFAWLFFFLKEDVHPEPKKMLAKVFFCGALSTLVVIFLQIFLQDILRFFQIKDYTLISFFFFAISEEIFKFLAAFLVIRKSRFFDEPIDAMIYMITAALGFAMVENIAVMSNINILSEALGVITVRFVGATLLHALSSGLVGYYWARGLILKRNNQISVKGVRVFIFRGIIFATLLHMIFNYLILVSKEVIIYPTIFLIIAALFVFLDFERVKTKING
jgi:RsiW-degrading membrane proteinase PrsW (M82 family)